MIDYSLAGVWANTIHALAMGESNENTAAVGDGGQAIGILQQHPAFIWQWVRTADITVRRTWNELQIIAASRFFAYYVNRPQNRLGWMIRVFGIVRWMMGNPQTYTIEDVVQMYNLGVSAFNSGKRNLLYLQRWQSNMKKIGA